MIAGLAIARWAGREESPDTVLSHQGTLHPLNREFREMGNAPGNARGAFWMARVSTRAGRFAHGKCHRKCTASGTQHGDIPQENLRDVFAQLVRLVRVKRWGKSPPLVWQHTRHGKPRVVQGQVGGESRPGSSSQRSRGSRSTVVAATDALPRQRRKPLQRATLG